MIFNCDQGTLIAFHGEDSIEVRTDLGVRCIVSRYDRNEYGERFVDVPANWLHTDEEKHAVVLQALTIVDKYYLYKMGN